MTTQQIEQALIGLPPSERLRLARWLLDTVLEPKSGDGQGEFEYVVNSAEWLSIAESSFEFWNNEADAQYDKL